MTKAEIEKKSREQAQRLAEANLTILRLKEEKQLLEYRVDAMSDMGRINIAGGLLGGIMTNKGEVDAVDITECYDLADEMMTYYVTIIEKKAEEFNQAVVAAQKAEEEERGKHNDEKKEADTGEH